MALCTLLCIQIWSKGRVSRHQGIRPRQETIEISTHPPQLNLLVILRESHSLERSIVSVEQFIRNRESWSESWVCWRFYYAIDCWVIPGMTLAILVSWIPDNLTCKRKEFISASQHGRHKPTNLSCCFINRHLECCIFSHISMNLHFSPREELKVSPASAWRQIDRISQKIS